MSNSLQINTMSSPSISQVINVKLTQENYLLWSAQILPYLRSQGLVGFVDGSMPPPNQTITVESSEETGSRKILNSQSGTPRTSWYSVSSTHRLPRKFSARWSESPLHEKPGICWSGNLPPHLEHEQCRIIWNSPRSKRRT